MKQFNNLTIMNRHFLKIATNFISVFLLVSLIAAPIYFAKNAASVAGVKSESKYLLVSQIDKFPNLKLFQTGNSYQISFSKLGASQAFLDILILNNPTADTQTYAINVTSGSAKLFFGHDLKNQQTKIAVPSQTSVPISLFSSAEVTGESQTVNFTIQTEI